MTIIIVLKKAIRDSGLENRGIFLINLWFLVANENSTTEEIKRRIVLANNYEAEI